MSCQRWAPKCHCFRSQALPAPAGLPNPGVRPPLPIPISVLVLGGWFYGLMTPLHCSAGAGGVTSLNIGILCSRLGNPVWTSVLCPGPGAPARSGALRISQPGLSAQEFSCEAQRDHLNNLIPGCDQAWRKGEGNKEAPSPDQQKLLEQQAEACPRCRRQRAARANRPLAFLTSAALFPCRSSR